MVERSVVAMPADVRPWPSLLDFFAARFPHVPLHTWRTRFDSGDIYDATNACVAQAVDAPRAHARYTYARTVANEPNIPLAHRIVFQDDHILVADKPHFLPVVPSGSYVRETLLARLKAATGIASLTPAHRIDRETAGLVLFTIRPEQRGAYQSLFAARRIHKTYEAIAPFREDLPLPMRYQSRLERSPTHFMQAITVAGAPNAHTDIELIARLGVGGERAHYRLTPHTGARHQLRAQLAALGIPICNDAIYPTLKPIVAEDFAAPLQLLAKALAFDDPVTHQARRFESQFRLVNGFTG